MANIIPPFDSFETIEASIDAEDSGVATARVSYYASTAVIAARLLKRGQTCPLVDAGLMRSARFIHGSATTEDGGVWKVNLVWKGASSKLRLNESIVPNYLPAAQTSPIESLPNFAAIAGTPSDPLPGAVFDSTDGSFKEFAARLPGNLPNPRAGMKSYYQASLSITEDKVMFSEEITESSKLYAVGKIVEPDAGEIPDFSFPVPGVAEPVRDYLLASVELEDLGNEYVHVKRRWDQSGFRGWDTDIYEFEEI